MTSEEREFIASQFKSVNEKLDLMITPVREDITKIEEIQQDHGVRIGTLEQFKEGHQEAHKTEEKNTRSAIESHRFNWEILAASGIVGAFMTWITSSHSGG